MRTLSPGRNCGLPATDTTVMLSMASKRIIQIVKVNQHKRFSHDGNLFRVLGNQKNHLIFWVKKISIRNISPMRSSGCLKNNDNKLQIRVNVANQNHLIFYYNYCFNKSFMVKIPFLFTINSAAATAPLAKLLRLKASCLIEILSSSDVYETE